MKATTTTGEVLDVRPGMNLAGIRFVSVELPAGTLIDAQLYEWLRDAVFPYMVPRECGDDSPD